MIDGVRLLVHRDDLDEARRTLEDIESDIESEL
jgi:hypothetical protein